MPRASVRASKAYRGKRGPASRSLAPAFERSGRLIDEFLDDCRDRFLAADHADRLAGHDRATFNIAIDHRAAERAGPIMLDLELSLGHFDCALIQLLGDLALLRSEVDHLLVLQRPNRDDR